MTAILAACAPVSAPCASCTIAIDSISAIGSSSDALLSSTILSVSSISGDSIGVFDWNEPGHVKLFLTDGTFLFRFGQRGEGPGEFERPRLVVHNKAADAFYVFDAALARVTAYASLGGPPMSVFSLPLSSVTDAVALDDGRLVVAGVGFSDQAVGLPLHLLEANGDYISSFGAEPAILGNWDSGVFFRSVARSRLGGVWSAHRDAYVVERWNDRGQLEQRFDWSAVWFPPEQEPMLAPRTPDETPSTLITDISEDSEGRLWIIINLPAPNWSELLRAETDRNGNRVYHRPQPLKRLWHTRVEVRSGDSGELLATADFPVALLGMLPGGVAWSVDYSEALPNLRLWRLSLLQHREVP